VAARDEAEKEELLPHIRQDLKLVAFMLMGIMVIRGGFPAQVPPAPLGLRER
jgi:hypothetical protein